MTLTKIFTYSGILFMLMSGAACTQHEVNIQPVEIKPIHITVDVNVKIDRAVDDFFDDIYGDQPE